MASLDVLDYQAGLDEALARAGLPAPLRRQAVKEARRIVDAMAFRFALMDERPLPEDLDYLRAIEAMKPPARAAEVLVQRKPLYVATRRRRLITSYGILLAIVVGASALAYLATSEEAEELAVISHQTSADTTFSSNKTFTVTANMTRLHLDGTILVAKDSQGLIEIWLVDPLGEPQLYEAYAAQGNVYLRENVYDPMPGDWTLLVDYLAVKGSVRVTVDGIRPTR